MQKIQNLLFAFLLLFAATLSAQAPGGGMPGGGGFDPAKMNIGHFYGKVVDANGKGIGYATVKLFGKKFDPATKTQKDTLLGGQLTLDNGDFSLAKLPVMGDFTLNISFLGYAEHTQTVTFGLKGPGGGKPGQTPPMPGAGSNAPGAAGMPGGGFAGANFEKDLGNIKLLEDSKVLNEITITKEAGTTTLALDRKSYRVDKDISAAGGTAQDALKNVPSLSVDLDGNVSLRNGAPQIFVDGRPTTLTLDQIAADAIESVEVITNPSAKFDAGGGTAGIVNIVLKKERKLGYNGSVRTGADTRGGFNFGGDFNARGEKINLFGALNLNRNKGFGDGETIRQNYFGAPLTNVTQATHNNMNGLFANGRAGVDFFLDNRNTLTLGGNYTRGEFHPSDIITTTTDYLYQDSLVTSAYTRNSAQDRNFRNLGASMQFKHLFPKKGEEWTADINYNQMRFKGGSNYNTLYDNGDKSLEKQEGTGRGSFFTFQSDFVNPLTEKTKLETGVRASMRANKNDNASSYFDYSENLWNAAPQLSDHYKYNDNVFAAYGQMSHQRGNWGLQAGLRAESSFYNGALTDRDSSFTIAYPISLFPSVFLTRKLNETDNIQLAYTRRVNRPNFFQTMPFTDFSDSLNLRRGNPQLLPEFTNSLEFSYQNSFAKSHTMLLSLYYKEATNLIASYQFTEFNSQLGKEVVVTSYANTNYAAAYGAELTVKDNFFKWLDLTTNLNVYQSNVNANNVESGLEISRLSAYLKETVQIKLPKQFFLQFNGEYRTRTSYTPSNNNDPFRGGPGGGPSQNTAQGYSIPNYFMDASVRKDFWQNKASLTLSVQDVFRTRRNGYHTVTDFFTQDSNRIQAPQTVRLNFSYRFGKMDASLFNRKNNRVNTQGNDMM